MQIGAILAGRFEVVSMLAEGGMAEVVEARDAAGLHVAIKLLHAGYADEPEVVLRFEREARIASTLKSRHAVRILDCGVTDGGRPFIVTELLVGHSLAHEIRGRGALPLEEAAQYVSQACHAMIEAHGAGIVHRDLKPSNLFLCRDGARRIIKVLDFGIARMAPEQGDDPLTHTKSLFGTPLYMSPESFRSAKASDARSDVWSLGVIFYECLTGVVPFQAETGLGVGLAVAREKHLPPTQRRAELPHSTDVMIARALKKDPNERYQSVRELMAALELYLPQGRNETMELRRVVAPGELASHPSTERGIGPRAPLLSDPETSDALTRVADPAHDRPGADFDPDDAPTMMMKSQPPPMPVKSQPPPMPAHSQPPPIAAPITDPDSFEPVPFTMIVNPPTDPESAPGTLVMKPAESEAAPPRTQAYTERMGGPDITISEAPETTKEPPSESREFDLDKLVADLPLEDATGIKRPPLSSLPNPFGDPDTKDEPAKPAPMTASSLPPPPPRRRFPFVIGFVSAAVVLVGLAWVVARMLPPAPRPTVANAAAAAASAEASATEAADVIAPAAVTAEPTAPEPTAPPANDPEPVASETATADASAAVPATSVSASASARPSSSPRVRVPRPRVPKNPTGTPPPTSYEPTDI